MASIKQAKPIEYSAENSKLTDEICKGYSTIYNIRTIVKSGISNGIRFFIRIGDELFLLEHWKENGKYKSQWSRHGSQKIGQIVSGNSSLSHHNPKVENSLLKQVEKVLDEYQVRHILQEAGELLSNYEDVFFHSESDFKLEGETKKESELRRIALELEEKYHLVIDSSTKELYIYNEEKGIYELYDIYAFNSFLQKEYDYKFFKEEAKKIMSSFTGQKEESNRHVAFKNCLYDLKTMETVEHTPGTFCTFQIPYNFNPDAKSPYFEKKLKEILCIDGDETNFKLFMQMVGYCFTNDNRHNKIFLITGPGGNGKSTLMASIRKIFGDGVVSVSLQDFNKNFGLQPLIKAKVNILYDLPLDNIGDTGVLKAITGEDSITIDRKFKEPVTTQVSAKIIGTGNALPKSSDFSPAFLRRLIHIELTNTFDEPEADLPQKLTANTKGMEWLISNALKAYKTVETEGWVIKPTIDENRESYLKKSNPQLWAAEQLFEPASNEEFIYKENAYEIMFELLLKEGFEPPKRRKPYYDALVEIGGASKWKGKNRIYRGLKLKTTT